MERVRVLYKKVERKTEVSSGLPHGPLGRSAYRHTNKSFSFRMGYWEERVNVGASSRKKEESVLSQISFYNNRPVKQMVYESFRFLIYGVFLAGCT